MTTVTITVQGYYRDATTTVRAAVKQTVAGSRYLEVTWRQMHAAGDRCCYAGTDYPVLCDVPGYTPWRQCQNGDWIAYED